MRSGRSKTACSLQAACLPTANGATGRVRRLIINRGCDLVDKFGRGAVTDPPVAETVMCPIESAKALDQLNAMVQTLEIYQR